MMSVSIIQTPRLELREWCDEDLVAFAEMKPLTPR